MSTEKIILFTGSYPYSIAAEDSFVKPELKVMSNKISIVVVPLSKKGDYDAEVGNIENISIDESLPELTLFDKLKLVLLLVINKYFYVELFKNLLTFFKKPSTIFQLIKDTGYSIYIANFVKQKIKNKEWCEKDLYYTFWFTSATHGLLALKEKFRLKIISRAHGYDLFEERRIGGYIPYRSFDIRKIDYVFTVSQAGENYLKSRYNIHNVSTFYLGIPNHQTKNPINKDKTLKIVSCSFVTPVKRVPIIYESLLKFLETYNINGIWYHIGDGPKMEELRNLISNKPSKIIDVNLAGFVKNDEIYKIYQKQSFDYFITLSSSEGLPVSLMEAISYGIPCIATSVGGIPEIIFD